MAQVKIFGLREQIDPIKREKSDVIHSCVVDALQYPGDKRAHRFFPLDMSDFFYPSGRSVEAKTMPIRLLFERLQNKFSISPQDLEMTLFETPKHDWGFRGTPGDEHQLNYKVEV